MTKTIRAAAIAALLCLAACESSKYGVPCVGLLDQKRTDVQYEVSIPNVAAAVLFSGTVIVPIVVAGKMLECPTSAPTLAEPKK